MNIDSIEALSSANALFRPGPLQSGIKDDFVAIRNGQKKTKKATRNYK